MQSLQWYRHRLLSMSPGEIAWRLQGGLRDNVDHLLLPFRRDVLPWKKLSTVGPCLGVNERAIGLQSLIPGDENLLPRAIRDSKPALIRRAERLLLEVSLFDRLCAANAQHPQWNYELECSRPAPMRFAPSIDYRSHEVTGDAKIVWELNRHHHLVVLGRAYRVTGDQRYADAVVGHIFDWIAQCPYGKGMNWRSPLELAIRVINWVFALNLIAPARRLTPAQQRVLLTSVHRHIWEIQRKYSKYSSANNHRIGEAAGVFIASCYFRGLPQAGRWRHEAWAILEQEIQRQTHPDGGHREGASGYHLFVLEFLFLAAVTARNAGLSPGRVFLRNLDRMFSYAAMLSAATGEMPALGDCDDGFVLDLAEGESRLQGLLVAGESLLDQTGLAVNPHAAQRASWLGLRSAGGRILPTPRPRAALRPAAAPWTGLYLLQGGDSPRRQISVVFRCGGEFGFGAIAAHAHADALSFMVRAFGEEFLIDPGTYDYFTHPKWREYFRSTKAHNTVEVDGVDQSQMLGPFLWGQRARSECMFWNPNPWRPRVCGTHDGYGKLADPVSHRRTISLDVHRQQIAIRDDLSGARAHRGAQLFHFAEHCDVTADGHRLTARGRNGTMEIELDPAVQVSLYRGSETPAAGWISRSYHRKTPSVTAVARFFWHGEVTLQTRCALSLREDSKASEGRLFREEDPCVVSTHAA